MSRRPPPAGYLDRYQDAGRLERVTSALDGHHQLSHDEAHTFCTTCWWMGEPGLTQCPYDGVPVAPNGKMIMNAKQSAEVAIRFVEDHSDTITSLLPTHVPPRQWLAVVTGALRKPAIAEAAANNLGAFANALVHASRLGLEPGTEQFHLVPQSAKKGEPRQILGIVGYQGMVELIYRAGAVSSVIAEVVHTGDGFEYQPGVNDRPIHKIDWDAADRGDLRLAYAYAQMKDGAFSRVVVLNKVDINRIKQTSASAGSPHSPWNKHPASMWRKSALRQLEKWVPTSGEFRREQLRAVQDVIAERAAASGSMVTFPTDENVDPLTGEVIEGELVEPTDQAEQQPAEVRS